MYADIPSFRTPGHILTFSHVRRWGQGVLRAAKDHVTRTTSIRKLFLEALMHKLGCIRL